MRAADIITPRVGLLLVLAVVLARGAIAIRWAEAPFNADLATTGLMAKHLAQGRAFPVMQYGLEYVLVLEAWLAAPLALIQHNSPALLTAVPVALNVAAVLLLYGLFSRSGLAPLYAVLATLPLAMPSVSAAGELSEPLGMNIEPLLFSLLLWAFRDRPIALGSAAAIGVKNREFVLYAIAALILVDLVRDRSAAFWRARIASAIAFATAWTVLGALMEFSTPLGPGTTLASLTSAGDSMTKAVSTICFVPSMVPHDLALIAARLLPFQFGLHAAPAGSNAHGGPGTLEALWLWPLLLATLAFGALRGGVRAWTRGPSPVTWFGSYLVLIGAQAVGVYAMARCGNVGFPTLRYTLLSVLGACGAIALAMEREPARVVRTIVAGVCSVWLAVCLAGHARLVRIYASGLPARSYYTLVSYLEEHGIRYIVTDYWTGYQVAYLTDERVRALTGFDRVREHALAVTANMDQAVRVSRVHPSDCADPVDVDGFTICRIEPASVR